MSNNTFLDFEQPVNEPFDATLLDSQPAAPPQQPPSGNRGFYAQPNPVAQANRQQANAAWGGFMASLGSEAGKSQAGLWTVAQAGAAGLPGFLKKVVQIGGLCALAAWGDVLIEPVVHRPIAENFITSVAPGDGNAYVFNPAVPFDEQHWTIQAKTKQAVNVLLFAIAVLSTVLWEPKTPAGVSFKYRFLLALAFVSAPIALF